ncbi:MAG: Nif3-like dinuclear metal center hexameric protein [Verrucomicrobiae bacterium]|nr:Nif3-like dinuclear metal center hexameric protein [Verrucomicrobiae bacterium]MDW7981061.1 Nif3-like dinuclear metal center hexameric protein [Verrucomicrobiales bacterium]
MPKVKLCRVVNYCDTLLRTTEFKDYEGAVNGLQLENNGLVSRIGAAVDLNLGTVKLAVESRADLLLVHHGLFWSGAVPWRGNRFNLLKSLIEHNVAVYSSHLPLDAHPRIGNNAQLCAALGLKPVKPFFEYHGQPIGFIAEAALTRAELATRLKRATGAEPRLIPAGPDVCRTIGVLTGNAGAELRRAAAAGADTLITGEGPHWTFTAAEELGINIFYAGHYATETLGVKALAAHLSRKFRLPWVFLDHPSGL